MRIIDPETGKRVDGLGVAEVKELSDKDPFYTKADKDMEL